MTVNSFAFPHFSLDARSLGISSHVHAALPTNAPLIKTVSIVGASLVAAPMRWGRKGVGKLIKPHDDALRLALVRAVDMGFKLHPQIFVLIYNYHKYGNDFCSTACKSDLVVVYRVRQGADAQKSMSNWKGAIEIASPLLFTSYSFMDQPTGIFHELRAHNFVNGTYKHGGGHQEILALSKPSATGAKPAIILHSQSIVRATCIQHLPSFNAMVPSA